MPIDINDERSVRLQRLKELQDSKIQPYPNSAARTHTLAQVGSEQGSGPFTVVGRIRGLRRHGGSTFLDLEDNTGRFQVFCSRNDIGEERYDLLVVRFDIGDFLQVTGERFTTKAGQLSLKAESIEMLAKALRPLPDPVHGLTDTEQRYRQRELDLLANPEAIAIAKQRSVLIKSLRSGFEEAGFLEVETPILQNIAGGAAAKPFITHHNVLDKDLFLRVAPELYLKRLIIGGIERVYEIARCFRNEGIDTQHNPEFTQIEFYAAYWDYKKMMNFCEQLVVSAVENVRGMLDLEVDGKAISFTPPFSRISYVAAIQDATGINVLDASEKDLLNVIKKLNVKIEKNAGRGRLIDILWKNTVRPNIHKPTFVMDYPVELSPLAKRKNDDPRIVEMFQLVISGAEVVKAFTELNDPQDQAKRFAEQDALRAKGDDEAEGTDPLFVESMEYGMPPTAGAGIGIDRLAAIITGSHSLKEVILFPTLRPTQ